MTIINRLSTNQNDLNYNQRVENYMEKLIALENQWIDVYDAIADGDHDNWVNFINDRIDFDF